MWKKYRDDMKDIAAIDCLWAIRRHIYGKDKYYLILFDWHQLKKEQKLHTSFSVAI